MTAERIDGTRILTAGGRYVDPLHLRVEDIDPRDIAHALANQCRYTGHTSSFYSVAEHSVRCARWLEDREECDEDVRWALMHDASEAYLVDIPRPLKADPYFGKAYRGAEDRAMAVVCERFGLPKRMPDVVRDADVVLLATERRDLMPPRGEWVILDGVPTIERRIVPWSPRRARGVFLHEYARLFGEGA